ncbi:MAG: tRNA-dihydrouridine synthase, partial [Pseudomonadota bacterium]
VAAVIAACPVEVTLPCRSGGDDQDPDPGMPQCLRSIQAAGVRRVAIHARKAWLQGLSPKENRDIPPLDYDIVHRMKAAFPDLHISVNGGITSLAQARTFLDAGLDGVMIGRAAYHAPFEVLGQADAVIFGDPPCNRDAHDVVEDMLLYIAAHLAEGGRLHSVTRHMLGLFAGRPGARAWRRTLSEGATRPGAGLDLVRAALAAVPRQVAA